MNVSALFLICPRSDLRTDLDEDWESFSVTIPTRNSINEFSFYKSLIANLILLKITLQNTLIILCFLSTCDPEILLFFIVRNRISNILQEILKYF